MKLSIINPGGIDNFGERAILIGTIQQLKERSPNAEIAIFGYENIEEEDKAIYEIMQFHRIKIYPKLVQGSSPFTKLISSIKFYISPKAALSNNAFNHLK